MPELRSFYQPFIVQNYIKFHLMIVSHILIYVSKKAKNGGIVAGFVKLDFYIGAESLSFHRYC